MQPWQREAIEFADEVGELAFAQQWVANALSKVSLHVGEVTIDKAGETVITRSDDPTANAALAALFYGEAGQSQMMAAFGHHLTTPGESWLFGVPPQIGQNADDDLWRVLSVAELTQQGKKWQVDRGDGDKEMYDAEDVLSIRVWRPHPVMWVQATSPVRAAIPILREIRALTQHIASTVDSRLTGAGIMLVPSEATFSTPVNPSADPNDTQGQRDLLVEWAELMAVARRDPASAAAQVPLLLRVPGALLDKVQHIDISTTLDKAALELRTEAIRRLALAMDMPPEVMLGQADSNHWSAWLIDDDSIKMHVEPLVEVITSALTTQFLWVALQGTAASLDPALRRFVIIGDTSELRQRPNRSTEALALHATLDISDAAMLRETGFTEADQPDDEEVKRRLIIMAAMGKISPELAASALSLLGAPIALEQAPRESIVAPPGTAPALNPADAPAVDPTGEQAPPSPAAAPALNASGAEQAAALLASAELICGRAMERATLRLGKRRLRGAPDPSAVTAALADAWDRVPQTAALLGVDAVRLRGACEGYTRRALTDGHQVPDRMQLAGYLSTMVLHPPRALEPAGG